MTQESIKPLNWEPTPGIGYTVVRRPDGGMHYTFTDLSHETLEHWHEFVVKSEEVRLAIEKIPSLTTPGGVEFGLFTNIEESEAWLDRPLTLIV